MIFILNGSILIIRCLMSLIQIQIQLLMSPIQIQIQLKIGHQINNLTCNSCTFLRFSWFVIIVKKSYNLFDFFCRKMIKVLQVLLPKIYKWMWKCMWLVDFNNKWIFEICFGNWWQINFLTSCSKSCSTPSITFVEIVNPYNLGNLSKEKTTQLSFNDYLLSLLIFDKQSFFLS